MDRLVHFHRNQVVSFAEKLDSDFAKNYAQKSISKQQVMLGLLLKEKMQKEVVTEKDKQVKITAFQNQNGAETDCHGDRPLHLSLPENVRVLLDFVSFLELFEPNIYLFV